MQLQIKDQLMMDNTGIKKIAYDFRRDPRTAQLCSCRHNATAEVKSKSKMHGETNVMITYDVTCPNSPKVAQCRLT